MTSLISYCCFCRILSTAETTSFAASSTAASTGPLSPMCPSPPPKVAGSHPTNRIFFRPPFLEDAIRNTFNGSIP